MTREEAIDILKDLWQVSIKGSPIEEALEIAIEALEEPHWIPCSERLPEEDGLYIVTTSKGQVQAHVFSNGNSEEYWMRCNKAFMPLPEPWRGDAE